MIQTLKNYVKWPQYFYQIEFLIEKQNALFSGEKYFRKKEITKTIIS